MNNIYISTFGKKVINLENSIPIEVGANNRSNFLYPVHDTTGNNISNENKYYGELTGLYWIWKNESISDEEMIGYCHYNKCLDIKPKKAHKLLITEKKFDFLVAEKTYITPHGQKDELQAITTILKDYYPDYFNTWNELYASDGSGNECNNAQLFITTGKYFKQYCSFLFDVLEKMRKIVGDKLGSPYDTRYCAFMGERLLSVFIRTNHLRYGEYDIRYAKKTIYFGRKIARYLHIDKNSNIYKIMQKKFGAKSSYKK